MKKLIRSSQADCVEQYAGSDRWRRGNLCESRFPQEQQIQSSQSGFVEKHDGTVDRRRRIIEAVERHSETKPKYPQEQPIRSSQADCVEQYAGADRWRRGNLCESRFPQEQNKYKQMPWKNLT